MVISDSDLVVELRSNLDLVRHLHQFTGGVQGQRRWFADYIKREGDFYFVVFRQRSDLPEGTVAIYNLDQVHRRAEWGRWILRPGSMAALESAYLTYQVAFEQLGLDEIYSTTHTDNEQAVSFHDSCGIPREKRLTIEVDGRRQEAVRHRLLASEWPRVAAILGGGARRLAEMLERRS
jgi:RimJ/RimL family protein N-acetyltransferase